MKLNLRNVGPLKDIALEIGDLTVLAAANSSGKSTIGKALYCTIKAINNYKTEILKAKKDKLEDLFQEIYERIENNLTSDELQFADDDDGNTDLYSQFKSLTDDFISRITFEIKGELIKGLYDVLKKYIQSFKIQISETDQVVINNLLKQIELIIFFNNNYIYSSTINDFFKVEFENGLINYKYDEAAISLEENSNEIFNVKFKKNSATDLEIIKNSQIKDVTYIESPININDSDSVGFWMFDKTIYSKNSDLKKKLEFSKSSTFDIFENAETNQLLNGIHEIIGGSFNYSSQLNKEVIYNTNGNKISLKNTATGIKAFAIIELLIKNKRISEKDMLIIDEPEVHLHPKWQIEFARIIVEMVAKLKIKVLINTHSTYFIEAIELFSKINKIEEKTSFYSLISEGNGTVLKNCTGNLEYIYSDLNKSFDILDEYKLKLFSGEFND